VWRGCTEAVKRLQSGTLASNVSPPIDSCEDVLSTQTVECTATCLEHRCNKYTTGFTDCWYDLACPYLLFAAYRLLCHVFNNII